MGDVRHERYSRCSGDLNRWGSVKCVWCVTALTHHLSRKNKPRRTTRCGMGGMMDGQMDGRTDGTLDGEMDGQIDI